MDKWTNVRSCHIGSRPPSQRLGPVCYFRELWASTRQTPEAGPSTRRSTDCALQLWCGHLKSHLDLSGISTASGLVHPQPRPGSIYYFSWAWVGCQGRRSFFSTHIYTHMYTHTYMHKWQRDQVNKYCQKYGLKRQLHVLPHDNNERRVLYRHIIYDSRTFFVSFQRYRYGCMHNVHT